MTDCQADTIPGQDCLEFGDAAKQPLPKSRNRKGKFHEETLSSQASRGSLLTLFCEWNYFTTV